MHVRGYGSFSTLDGTPVALFAPPWCSCTPLRCVAFSWAKYEYTSCYQPLSDTFRSRDDFRSLRPAVGLPPLRRLLVSHISPFSRGGTCNNTRFPPPRSRSRPTPEWNSSRSGSTWQWLFKQVGWVCRARFCSLHSPQTEVPCGRSRPFSVRRLLLGCKFVTPV